MWINELFGDHNPVFGAILKHTAEFGLGAWSVWWVVLFHSWIIGEEYWVAFLNRFEFLLTDPLAVTLFSPVSSWRAWDLPLFADVS